MYVRKMGLGQDSSVNNVGMISRWGEGLGFSPGLICETSDWNRNALLLELGFLNPKLKVLDLTMPRIPSNLSLSDIQIPPIWAFKDNLVH